MFRPRTSSLGPKPHQTQILQHQQQQQQQQIQQHQVQGQLQRQQQMQQQQHQQQQGVLTCPKKWLILTF